MTDTNRPAWTTLTKLATQTTRTPLAERINEQGRSASLTHTLGGVTFDFTKQPVSGPVISALLELARESEIEPHREDMFSGEAINTSEGRSVLHTALRARPDAIPTHLREEIKQVRQRAADIANQIRHGQWRGATGKAITDIVHIGIGGSHLGPELVVSALDKGRTFNRGINCHFVVNVDAYDIVSVLNGLNPETTLFIIASKSFTTLETQVNANTARSWFLERTGNINGIAAHFVAVSTNVPAAQDFGIHPDNILPMWDWVGGRFSLWSAVGLPIMITLGTNVFDELLAGAELVDSHFRQADAAENIPLLAALFATWNFNFLGAGSLAILCYDERLRMLPDFLQQLEMESNGKSVTLDGSDVQNHTMPVLWGGTGTRGQHAYHQLLHQGTRAYAADFILSAEDAYAHPEHHRWLQANALAQSQAMAAGSTNVAEPHRNLPGNHASTTIVVPGLDATSLGILLATYEHKVFCQGVIWNINSFDQWGVELGKQLAIPIFEELNTGKAADVDAATRNLLNIIK